MGKHELKKRILELSRSAKSKLDIYTQLEPEVNENQKQWLVKKIISVVKPDLIKKYRPFNLVLILLLITQYLFSYHIFVNGGLQFSVSQILLIIFTSSIYLLLMIGVYKVNLIAYNALIVLYAFNIAFGLFYLFTPTWLDGIISSAINIGQIIYVIWLQNRMFPEIRDYRQGSRVRNKNVLSHP